MNKSISSKSERNKGYELVTELILTLIKDMDKLPTYILLSSFFD